MEPSIGAHNVDRVHIADGLGPVVADVRRAHTPFIAHRTPVVGSNRPVTGFLFREAVGSTYRGEFRMAALGR